MPRLTPGDRHVNRPITDMAIAAFQGDDNFIAKNAPMIKSLTKSNQYFVYTSSDFNRIEVRPRAPATRAHRAGFAITTATFTTARYALGYDITDEEDQNYDQPLDPEGDAVRYLSLQMNLFHEDNLSSIIFAASWGTNLTGVAGAPGASQFKQWDQPGSTPIEDIRLQKRTVLTNTGFVPNELWLSQAVWDVLVDHPEIVDRMKYTGAGDGARRPVTKQALADLLEIDVVRVSKAVKNTANEGQAASHSFIFGKAALLVYLNREPKPRVKEPSAFYRFAWTGFYGAEEQGFRLKRYRTEDTDSTSVIVDTAMVNVITANSFGVYYASAVS